MVEGTGADRPLDQRRALVAIAGDAEIDLAGAAPGGPARVLALVGREGKGDAAHRAGVALLEASDAGVLAPDLGEVVVDALPHLTFSSLRTLLYSRSAALPPWLVRSLISMWIGIHPVVRPTMKRRFSPYLVTTSTRQPSSPISCGVSAPRRRSLAFSASLYVLHLACV